MFVAFILIVVVLYVIVRCHFHEYSQWRRRREIEEAGKRRGNGEEEEMVHRGGNPLYGQ